MLILILLFLIHFYQYEDLTNRLTAQIKVRRASKTVHSVHLISHRMP